MASTSSALNNNLITQSTFNISNALQQLATIKKQQQYPQPSSKFDTQSEAELLVLFHSYIGKDPKYREVADKLQEALDAHQVLPPRYDIEGNPHPQTLATFLQNVGNYANSLPDIFQRLCQLQVKFAPPPIHGLPIRLFTTRKTALDRKANEKVIAPPLVQSVICTRPSPIAIQNMHPLNFLRSRELGRNMPLLPKQMFRKEFMQLLNRQIRIMGHLSSVFCVAFDRSGRYIFTGADDNLIKCWDAQQFLLRFTFRGHIGEISELSVSHENSLLGSGSVDKIVRIWSLRNGATIRVYKGHSATINSIAFIPLFFEGSDWRWLVTAGNDCAVIFHRYKESTKEFFEPPIKFNERASGGARIISSSHSPGGNIVIMGDTHQAIIVYKLNELDVHRLYEFTAHSDRVDTLAWAHHSLRFVSGSKDGTAKVWKISCGQWTSTELIMPKSETAALLNTTLQKRANATSQTANKKNAQNGYKVTMLTWSLDDDVVISIGSDYLLRTWDWKTGIMLGKYAGHQNETFSLVAHPLHRELVISAGHDGWMIVWNIYTGQQICRHRNMNNNREAVAIFDMAISPDGTTVGFVDSVGCLSIYGVTTNNQFAMMRPHEQFFSTDYRLLQIDPDGWATDEDTGLWPEQLAPPFFVTSDGTMHPEKEQRLVPGNDIKSNDVIKPCAWLKRNIIDPLRPSILEKYKREQIEHCRREMMEFEKDHRMAAANLRPHPVHQVIIPVEQTVGNIRQRNPTNSSTTRTRANRNAEIRQLAEYMLQNPPVPRYVLDDEYTDDENDRSFSLGSDEEELEEEEFIPAEQENVAANRQQPQHSADESGTSGDETSGDEEEEMAGNDGEEDENDSDYEVGRSEHQTVFRERSTWTVTGKRKRRPPVEAGNEQDQQGSSHDSRLEEQNRYRSERLRTRAAAAALASASNDSTQPSSSTQPIRRIKTRLTAFIASSDGEDMEEQSLSKIEPKREGKKHQRGSKKVRSGKLIKRRQQHVQKRIKIEQEEGEDDELDGNEERNRKLHQKKRKLNRKRGKPSANSSTAGGNRRQQHEISDDEDIDEENSFNVGTFPEWMRKTTRTRFPFIPQLGDLVVYFQQGHRAYVEELKKRKVRVPAAYDIPSFLDAQEICYIDEIKYVVLRKCSPQIRVAVLRLARTKHNKRYGTSFTICYHDMKDIIDFLVLKQHFDASMAMKLTDGDRIESIIDDEIFTGIVVKIDAYEPEYPNSEWSSVAVNWDNGDSDRFNPWDLQKSTRRRATARVVATAKDLDKLGEYQAQANDWLVPAGIGGGDDSIQPAKARQLYLERARLAINQLGQLGCLKEFMEPVDLQKYRNYIGFVIYPIDLGTISERIHNNFYRRSLSFLSDVQYLAKNANIYNDSDSDVVHWAVTLVETIFTFMENWEEKNARVLFEQLEANETTKMHAWKRKLHPAECGGGRISTRELEVDSSSTFLRRLSRRSSSNNNNNNAGESTNAAAASNSQKQGGNGSNKQKEQPQAAVLQKNKLPLWTVECNDMIDRLNEVFMEGGLTNRDMNNSAYEFISNLREKTDSLISKCRTPQTFLNQIREFLSTEKNRVNDAESRRSKTYQAILNMELQLEQFKQPIMAKYNRMMADEDRQKQKRAAATNKATGFGVRQKRQAAVSAQLQWRHFEDEEEEEEEANYHLVKKAPREQQQWKVEAVDANVEDEIDEDDYEEEEEEMDDDDNVKEEDEGNDSDYEIGRYGRDTAVNGRSNKRRRQTAAQESSYRSRLRTRGAVMPLLDETQPSTSSSAVPAQQIFTSSGRRIKPTRRQSFASSADGDDDELLEEAQTTKKKRRII